MDAELQQRLQAKAQLNTVQALSDILNTGLDRTSLELLLQLLEAGCNPEALAKVVTELRRRAEALEAKHSSVPIATPH